MARVIDSSVPVIILVLVANQLAAFGKIRFESAAWLIVGGFGVVYEVVLIALAGKTIGKVALGIKVVRLDDGDRPGWWSSIRRWSLPVALGCAASYTPGVSGFVLALLVLVSYGSVIWNPSRQAWSDMFAGTIVVKA